MSFNRANIRLENIDHHGIHHEALEHADYREVIGGANKKAAIIQKISYPITISIAMLREYYQTRKPQVGLFEGQKAREQNSVTRLAKVFDHSLRRAGTCKPVMFPSLHHSNARHLTQGGIVFSAIQKLIKRFSGNQQTAYFYGQI